MLIGSRQIMLLFYLVEKNCVIVVQMYFNLQILAFYFFSQAEIINYVSHSLFQLKNPFALVSFKKTVWIKEMRSFLVLP